MKFSSHIDQLEKNLITMKICTLSLSIAVIGLVGLLSIYSVKPPLVIERGTSTKAVDLATDERLATEIKEFVHVAVTQRFNSIEKLNPDYFSLEQQLSRTSEQKSLAAQNMTQWIIIESIDIKNNDASIVAARVVRLDGTEADSRSAGKFKLHVEFFSVDRSVGNPYGLMISKVEEIK